MDWFGAVCEHFKPAFVKKYLTPLLTKVGMEFDEFIELTQNAKVKK